MNDPIVRGTVDDKLELQNFKKAAEMLADVWTDHVIDNHPFTAVTSFDQDNADATNTRVLASR